MTGSNNKEKLSQNLLFGVSKAHSNDLEGACSSNIEVPMENQEGMATGSLKWKTDIAVNDVEANFHPSLGYQNKKTTPTISEKGIYYVPVDYVRASSFSIDSWSLNSTNIDSMDTITEKTRRCSWGRIALAIVLALLVVIGTVVGVTFGLGVFVLKENSWNNNELISRGKRYIKFFDNCLKF